MGGVLSSTTEYIATSYGFGLVLLLGVVGAAFGIAYAVVGPGGKTFAIGSYIIGGVLLSAAIIQKIVSFHHFNMQVFLPCIFPLHTFLSEFYQI